ncbi:MAG: hypothetical protein UX91_C0001G0046 [Candidatus Amesbacteria bacterium GW2011_GWB1_47_19]|nr:MAG: hypothetical protein UW51_C0001G0046 [Candidatus Amesbacteria bacterium GW2011_GWA1_44_24]KKU32058.1 MAG: hypothetical protein UX46_C0001G0045 [Candidatus Amesbacteria bacterium GW2011_GWC1_46_24]KKU67742.1 MAG: hypothetical protein UX91_C0001G0046 [Candidatus Amesbacteria bacterium GW2011_GWB1_47_19]OGD06073.1 MAG: hypothetical protein A2379_03195 [Candidatus Amesbacteria bacterium RIFOXYB1_FULL_47_13]HBC72337.1 hypothetical protein [Candidatus Amesbacteria bacterium]
MPARARTINLLPLSGLETSFWGKLLKWAITSGRYIIIVTELVVILAFLSRFKLDSDLVNLNEEINGKVNILNGYAPLEQEFIQRQARLEALDKLLAGRYSPRDKMDKLAEKVPPELKLAILDMDQEKITSEANSLGEQALGTFITGLGKDPTWKSIELTQVSEEPLKGIKFSLVIKE